MKIVDWDIQKNKKLLQERGIGFEEVVFYITHGRLLDILEHPNTHQYPNQKIFIVNVGGYAVIVPFVEDEATIFLKTIIPSRKMTKKYIGGEKE